MDTRDLPDQEAREFYEERKKLDLRKKIKGYKARMYREDKAFYNQSGLSKNLGNLTFRDKQEIILKYHVDGGTVFGKRMTKAGLCGLLKMDQREFDKMYKQSERSLISNFDTKEKFRQQITLVISKVINQIDDNRARSVLHADLLENELARVEELLHKAYELPENTTPERLVKNERINRLMRYTKSLSEEKIELLKVMFSGTDSVSKLLQLFSGSSGAKSRFSIDPTGSEDEEGGADYVDLKTAIKLIESSGTSDVLPVQDNNSFGAGPRNPSDGFEELEKNIETETKPTGNNRDPKV